jgi:hypothetical protein
VVVSVSSCVRKGSEARTVPVSAAIEAEQNNASGASGDASNATAADANATAEAAAPEQQVQATDPAGGTAAMSNTGVTSVSVSVASGAVTWLEIECDGVSEVADTVTGPWQHTYTVEESLLIEALTHIVDTITLVIPVFIIVVIIEVASLWSVFSCVCECFFYEAVVAINRYPCRCTACNIVIACNTSTAVVSCTVRVVTYTFITYVVCIKIKCRILLLDCCKHILDVAFKTLIHY